MTEISVNSRMLGLKDVNVHVEDSGGDGRPIVLIHGWPLSGASWKNQISDLRDAGYRAITYDRRGFGMSDKPKTGYDYDTLADDLSGLINELGLTDVTLVGFSMGGGEVARYISKYGEDKLHSIVFASSVTPMMIQSPSNPDGPLNEERATKLSTDLDADPNTFYDQFTKEFVSANGDGTTMLVSDEVRQTAIVLCQQADKSAALEAMKSFAMTDFREDLPKITVPTLVIHGDADGVVPFIGSGKRTHAAIPHSELHAIVGGPHGINASHTDEFNKTLLTFLNT